MTSTYGHKNKYALSSAIHTGRRATARGIATTVDYDGHQTTISVFDNECPSRLTPDLIADKWAVLVIAAIHEGANRNGAMLRHIEGISQKMLTQALRGLERDGLITRTMFNEVPPRVEYALTPLGESLRPLVVSLCRWAIANVDAVLTARSRFAESTSE